jgi:elongation factor 1-beta
MAKVLVSIKIFPTGTDVDLGQLQQKIKQALPSDATVHKFATEPIAFGLNALIAYILIPEQKTGILQTIESSLQGIEEISQIQTLSATRV